MDPRVTALLLDMGGTLWPDSWPAAELHSPMRASNLEAAFPGRGETLERTLTSLLTEQTRREAEAGIHRQDVPEVIRSALLEHGLEPGEEIVRRVMRAMAVSPLGVVELFPGVVELLQEAAGCGLRRVLVSNTGWRGAREYAEDLAQVGIADLLDGIVASPDVGHKKPHRAMFEAALQIAGCRPEECVMVGNSEIKDVRPAREMGMRTILLAIERPAPPDSRADAVARSLSEVGDVLRSWGALC